jgi:hypothetical protein
MDLKGRSTNAIRLARMTLFGRGGRADSEPLSGLRNIQTMLTQGCAWHTPLHPGLSYPALSARETRGLGLRRMVFVLVPFFCPCREEIFQPPSRWLKNRNLQNAASRGLRSPSEGLADPRLRAYAPYQGQGMGGVLVMWSCGGGTCHWWASHQWHGGLAWGGDVGYVVLWGWNGTLVGDAAVARGLAWGGG